MDNQDYLAPAVEAAKIAGKIILEYYGRSASSFMLADKGNSNSILNKADKDAEKAIVAYLFEKVPGSSFLGEESGRTGSSELQWIIDPIDGTTNFANKIPLFCVSIGLAKNRELIAGVVYNPVSGEMFEAYKGNGAFLGGKRIYVAPPADKKEMVVATDWAHEPEMRLHIARNFLEKHVNDYRYSPCLGTAALSLAWVAAGRFHAYVHPSLNEWDLAAGAVLVKEAGGTLTKWDGGSGKLGDKELIASNGQFFL